MAKRVRISNNSLNSYGTRVLTAGMNVSQYEKNPVLLYMHERGMVIGYVKDLKVENDEVTGELMFDEATELSKSCKKQYDFGSLKMVSVGIDVIETSAEKADLIEGQTRETITKCKLYEVSLVDIGANDDAIVMKKNGETIKLGKDGDCLLPKLNEERRTMNDESTKNKKEMELKELALLLGLPETADEAAVKAKIEVMKTSKDKEQELVEMNKKLVTSQLKSTVDKAIADKKIGEEKREQFMKLGETIGSEELEKLFGSMNSTVKLSSMLGHQGGSSREPGEYKKLSDVPVEKILELREKEPDTYKKLYKAEYGMECEITKN